MIIKKPIITEKTVALAQSHNLYTFEVEMTANKIAAAKELERLFGVKVEGITSKTRLGKIKRFGAGAKTAARRQSRKQMTFKLKESDKIDLFTL